jgi:hypothetical protein
MTMPVGYKLNTHCTVLHTDSSGPQPQHLGKYHLFSISTYTHSPATYSPIPMQQLTHPTPPPPPYLHCTHTTIMATIHCISPLYLFISSHSCEHNTYYVAPEPKTTYSITFTNNYTTRRTTKMKPPLTHSSLLQC